MKQPDHLAKVGMTKEELKSAQLKETVDQSVQGVVVRLSTITCGCGWERGITEMYKCLYCGIWFCQLCAEVHFGKTIEEHRNGK